MGNSTFKMPKKEYALNAIDDKTSFCFDASGLKLSIVICRR